MTYTCGATQCTLCDTELGSGVNASLEDCKFADVRTGVAGHIIETRGVQIPSADGAALGADAAKEAAKALHK